jgi:hypothetical protein
MLEPGAFAQALSPVEPVRSLSEATLAALHLTFSKLNHSPTAEMWTALKAIAETLEAMAEGTCEDAIHLSSLDPGVGKTTTVIQFLKALLSSPAHPDVAALICVKRREQIDAIVTEAGIAKHDFAVLTADPALNSLGRSTADEARVLFTTHAMVEKRSQGRPFASVAAFHYEGCPRAVRIWDEAILPGKPQTVSRDMIAGLFGPLRGHKPELADALEDLFTTLRTAEDGSLHQLPDLAEEHEVSLNEALRFVHGAPAAQKTAVEALWFLFGKYVTVRTDGHYGNTLLDYQDTLPSDITPLLVLDASVRVRSVYRFWEERRGGIKRLPEAAKHYGNHTLHVWNKAGGKRAFKNETGKKLIEGIACTIRTKPQEEWLVIHHKDALESTFEADVRALLADDSDKVHFLHWGVHDATNRYSNVPNVILAGTLFYRASHYEALGRLASGHPSRHGAFPETDRRQVKLGEHHHLILQALCRGAVRRCYDGGCPVTHTYIVAHSGTGIQASLSGIFPGARVVSWKPVLNALKGKVKEAFTYIQGSLSEDPSTRVSFKAVMEAVGWTSSGDFRKRIRGHEDFIEALKEAGIEEWGPKVRMTSFRMKP